MSQSISNPVDTADAVGTPEEENATLCHDVALWKRPVTGSQLVDKLVHAVNRHLVVDAEAAIVIALWVIFTHVHEAFRKLPLLALLSPTRGCGKTTGLTFLGWSVRRPLSTSNMTPAVLFRAIDQEAPTVLLDEGDTFISKNPDLRGIINAGHDRETGFVYRVDKGQTRKFNAASPKAIAAIGSLPETIEQRSVIITMNRKTAGDNVAELASAEVEIRRLGQMAARWAADNIDRLRSKSPTIPSGLQNRAADNWRPLLAIAECAGGKWSKVARQAAMAMSSSTDTSEGAIGELLLQDLKPIITGASGRKIIPSRELVTTLSEMEHRPWPELANGRHITAPRMAHILRPFGITPELARDGNQVVRGYRPKQFEDAFKRYAVN